MGKDTLAGLLAAENDIRKESAGRMNEGLHVYKGDAVSGLETVYSPYNEGDRDIPVLDSKRRVTTVPERVRYDLGAFRNLLRLVTTREKSNTSAAANVTLPDGTVFEAVPVGVLMELPKQLQVLREYMAALPTLDNTKRWKESTNEEFVYVAETEKTIRRVKQIKHKIIVPATEQHPAQVAEYSDSIPVGEMERIVTSGAITSVRKAQMLRALDDIIAEFHRARGNANTSVPDRSLKPMVDSILNSIVGKELMDRKDITEK